MKQNIRILTLFTVAGLFVLSITGVSVWYLIKGTMQERETLLEKKQSEILASSNLIVPLLDSSINQAFELLDMIESFASSNPQTECIIEDESISAMIKNKIAANEWLGNLVIYDSKGDLCYSLEKTVTKTSKTKQERLSTLEIVMPLHNDGVFNPQEIMLGVPLYSKDGDYYGEAALSIRHSHLQEQLFYYLQEGVKAVALIDRQNTVLAIAYLDYSHRNDMIGMQVSDIKEFVSLPSLSQESAGVYPIERQNSLYIVESLTSMPLKLVSFVDLNEVELEWEESFLLPMVLQVSIILFTTIVAIVLLVLQAIQTMRSFKELQIRVEKSVDEIRQKDSIIYEQSKRKALDTLLIDLAHQWRQPLNSAVVIIQNIDFLLEGGKNDKQISFLVEKAEGELIRLSKTISKLTRFYEKESAEVVTFEEGAKKAIELSALSTQTTTIDIRLDIDPCFNIQAESDIWVELVSIFLNNLRDILKQKNLKNGNLYIKTECKEREALIIFEDDAGGIDDKLLPQRLFEAYSTTHFKGADKGLGLYIAKNIITHRFKGSIIAQNTDTGARFTISIPLL